MKKIIATVIILAMILCFCPSCGTDTVEIAVQVNGKIRTRMMVGVQDDAATVLAAAKADERIVPEIEGKTIVKELYVPKKLVNIVVK